MTIPEHTDTETDRSVKPHRHDKLNKVDFQWFVVHTLRHQERKLADLLSAHLSHTHNILEVYCPAHTTVNLEDKVRKPQTPLFAGYVFVLSTQEALVDFIDKQYPDGTILYERRTASGRKACFLTIPEGQMRFFKDFNENYAEHVIVLERPYNNYAFNPKTGEPNEIVKVLDGPLKGREGYLTRFHKERRLVFNMKAIDSNRHFAVSIPNVWNFQVVRLHNTEGDRQTIGTRKARAVDWLIGMLESCGYDGKTLPMLYEIVESLAVKPSFAELRKDLIRKGHEALSQRMASLSAQDAELILNLVRYEHDNPGYVRNHWDKHVIRPFLTPASGVEFEDGKDEAVLPHAHFTEIIRKTDITEQAYRPSKGEEESMTTTYYSHIGIMSDMLHGGYILFANWDIFLGQYFLTTGKANERLVEGTSRNGKGVKDGNAQEEKLIESFRNFAPTLYRVLTDKDSAVKALPRLKIGEETLNVLAITATDIDSAKERLATTCIEICKEINATTHLAVWRRYLQTVWLHQ